ncbi:MAG: hypothetical protein COZ69_08725 [Deltaproteobacteria bacterium CG_4_8_14_3_um_filter_45_9]|nr:MAG: hypothetical protein COS40_15490 [Deltaproteobacteria bacterium CG03_land_8_20_14_0_80_45_14]PIX23360.1 MAG: hypothetical protein COZ69_08725 [Deltaproteobacteria bacterium CG_4_8_14_3_um_filter_45_9]
MRKMKKMLGTRSMWGFLFVVLTLGLTPLWMSEVRAEMKPSLAILPFFIERGGDPGRGVVCPFCKRIYRKGDILPGSQNTLTRLLQEKVEAMGTFNVLLLEKVGEALSQSERRQFEIKPMHSSIRLGNTLNMNFIFVGYLFRFEERIGSSIGAEKPASVGFDVHLIRLRDEKIVWEGKFDETQRPLSENLFKIGSFVRRKASWLTAEELSSVGMEEMLKRFPGLKELEE